MSSTASKSESGKTVLASHRSILSADEQKIADVLIANDQAHLFAEWAPPGNNDAAKKAFLHQVKEADEQYPGGVSTYISRAKSLLALSAAGANPYEGFQVFEPKDSVRIESAKDFDEYERIGLQHIGDVGFIIVAGGLGERLGYKGIKLALPAETSTEMSYLELYIRNILALQDRARAHTGNSSLLLPFAIMTSDDTHSLTEKLLRDHHDFGLVKEQLTVFKQGKVPSMVDNDAHFCLEDNDRYRLDTKPHGHGDVHMLLYQYKIIQEWVENKKRKYLLFFQDTNGLVFHAIVAALGVSVAKNLHMNSLTVPRVQGDAVGAICTLVRDSKVAVTEHSLPSPLTINVEYNQLEGLLGKGVKEPLVSGSNWSIYPGNINVLLFNAVDYYEVLKEKKGAISEFVNPKYNADKKSFKKPTRLECMMQDWPKLLDGKLQAYGSRVGFTQFQRWTSFSAVKNAVADGVAKQASGNAAETGATGEADMYSWSAHVLRDAGVHVAEPVLATFRGIKVSLDPRIVLYPSFAVTQAEIRQKFPGHAHIVISSHSTLIVEGADVSFHSLHLNGTLIIRALNGAKVKVEHLKIDNSGWELNELKEDSGMEQKYAVRGFTIHKRETQEFIFDEPKDYVLSDATKAHLAEVTAKKKYEHANQAHAHRD